jgi:2-polyprenyl-3-methyl-5-hydroxy-6-metoxy-1,4-benzoquinol methylase
VSGRRLSATLIDDVTVLARMQRIIEPELMLDEEQVRAYAAADFEAPHNEFIHCLAAKHPGLLASGHALDLGCGAGDIARRFARKFAAWRVDGIDGSAPMLEMAASMTRHAGLDDRIAYSEVLLPALPFASASYDLIFSNSLLHHLEDPDVFWSTIKDWSTAGTRIFVMDLLRPLDRETAAALVERYAGDEPEILRVDFYNSLLAAFRSAEVESQLKRAGLAQFEIETVSDRHQIIWGSINA